MGVSHKCARLEDPNLSISDQQMDSYEYQNNHHHHHHTTLALAQQTRVGLRIEEKYITKKKTVKIFQSQQHFWTSSSKISNHGSHMHGVGEHN